MARYSIAEARNNLPELVDKALAGEEVTLTREGEAVVELRPSAPRRTPRPSARRNGGGLRARRAARPPLGEELGSRHPRDARWRAVTVYLDASFVVSLFVTDVHTERADRWIADLKEEAIVSELCALEFAASVSRRVRMGRDDSPGGGRSADRLRRLARAFNFSLPIDEADTGLAASLVRDFATKLARSGRAASCGGNQRSRKARYLRIRGS